MSVDGGVGESLPFTVGDTSRVPENFDDLSVKFLLLVVVFNPSYLNLKFVT